MTSPRRRTTAVAWSAVLAVVALLASGCVGIPDDGPVVEAQSEVRPGEQLGYFNDPPGPTADEPATDIVASLLASGAAEPTASGPTGFPNLAGSDFEWASEDMLELIWRGDEVPMEAVFAPARTIMPRVGPVRVFTNSGDVFEGRLYAVGQERVWIDAAPGRIGLDGNRIERIERLPFEQAATDDPDLSATGKRVRVRVPGGLLFGRVLKTEGEEVILALDDGGRVRVMSDSVEDIGSGRAIIVHR